MEIIKIAVLGISAAVLGIFLRQLKPEYATYVSLVAGILILIYAVWKMEYLFDGIEEIRTLIPDEEEYLNPLLKMIGITYIGQFASSICKDSGYQAIAGQIEIFCKLSILVISFPILLALIDTIQGFLT